MSGGPNPPPPPPKGKAESLRMLKQVAEDLLVNAQVLESVRAYLENEADET